MVGEELSFDQYTEGYNDVLRMNKAERDEYLKTFNGTLALKNRTHQYDERLLMFMKYRKSIFPETYWLG